MLYFLCYVYIPTYILINSHSGSLAANRVKIKHAKSVLITSKKIRRETIYKRVCLLSVPLSCICECVCVCKQKNARDSYLDTPGAAQEKSSTARVVVGPKDTDTESVH